MREKREIKHQHWQKFMYEIYYLSIQVTCWTIIHVL